MINRKMGDSFLYDEVTHEGFEDIMVYSKNYPKDSFDPTDYYNRNGYFIYDPNIPTPETPPIKRIQELEEIENNKNKVAILSLQEDFVLTLTLCPICKRMIDANKFEEHVRKCMEKEKKEQKSEPKKEEE